MVKRFPPQRTDMINVRNHFCVSPRKPDARISKLYATLLRRVASRAPPKTILLLENYFIRFPKSLMRLIPEA